MTLGRNSSRPKDSLQGRLSQQLLGWFDAHKRDLPWRQNKDPYRVWLSEVMLQQTRVAAVIEHYQRFLQRFPTIDKLAGAREASVLAVWSGLGYYRRARMLHAAAKAVVREHAGRFPRTAVELSTLPGIGRYTAAAIASIAFNEAVAVVDGNVERVLQRLQGRRLSGQRLWQTANQMLDVRRPGDFNQALMELGAMVCLPRQPKCPMCPLFAMCATRGGASFGRKPSRQRKEKIHFTLDRRKGSIFLVQRPKTASLMPGMWELPEISADEGFGEPLLRLRHSITVTDYQVRVVAAPAPRVAGGRWVAASGISKLPLTGLTRKILTVAKVI